MKHYRKCRCVMNTIPFLSFKQEIIQYIGIFRYRYRAVIIILIHILFKCPAAFVFVLISRRNLLRKLFCSFSNFIIRSDIRTQYILLILRCHFYKIFKWYRSNRNTINVFKDIINMIILLFFICYAATVF